ncbi:hypothetical protein RB597_005023 [Gaeumannomyces tritici]
MMDNLIDNMSRKYLLEDPGRQIFSFAFDAKAQEPMFHDPAGLYRSLLYQILNRRPGAFEYVVQGRPRLVKDLQEWKRSWNHTAPQQHNYSGMLETVLVRPSALSTVLIIDGLDEGDADKWQDMVIFFNSVTRLARRSGIQLRVCLASRPYGAPITAVDCLKIWIERNNACDIKTYVHKRLSVFHETVLHLEELIRTTLGMSNGIFLWVVLAVDSLVRDLEKGLNVRFLQNQLLRLPSDLHKMYKDVLLRNPDDRDLRRRFFQWVIFGGEIQLREWRDILPFLGFPVPQSLHGSQLSPYYADTEEQLIRLIRNISLGLVHVAGHPLSEGWDADGSVVESIGPAAGSLNSRDGNTRIVRVIHETVREFFVVKDGFRILSGNDSYLPTAGDGYMTIMQTCLNIIQVPELNPIIDRRLDLANGRQDVVSIRSTNTGNVTRSYRSRRSSTAPAPIEAYQHPSAWAHPLPARYFAMRA